jgi:hypothetical protein
VPGGLEVLERKVSSRLERKRGGDFYLQVIDNTGHTLDLVADSARDILE